MFTAKIQIVDRRGKYDTLASETVASFNMDLAKETMQIVEELNQTDEDRPFRAGLYIKNEPVPEGWASRDLPFSIQIWMPEEVTPEEARTRLRKFAAQYLS